MANLRAVLFKRPAVYWNDKQIVFPFAKMEALLYYLLVNGEATRENLAALFWGDREDNAARQNLRNTVYLLRKTLTSDLLITSSRASIALNPALTISTDLELLTANQIAEFLGKNPAEFLAGFSCKDAAGFDHWVSERREQFRKTVIGYLTKWILKMIKQEEYTAATKYLHELISLDAYNESAYRTLMKIYAKENSYTALEIYRDLERKMEQDLGLAPSMKTQELYHRIKTRKSVPNVTPELASSSQQFFGREKELRQIRSWLDKFHRGSQGAGMLFLQGDQGVGKTTIVEALIPAIPPEKNNVFRTQCYQAEAEYDYKAWNSIFLQAMAFLNTAQVHLPPLWQQAVAYAFPTVKIKEQLQQDAVMDAYTFNTAMREEILCAVLGQAAGLKKTVLVIEDIHWLDQRGWSLLWQILHIHGENICCVATAHREYWQQIATVMEKFERDTMLEYLTVERFSEQEVMQLAALRLPGISYKMQSRLYDYTGGNALFLNECLNLMAAGSDITQGSIRLNCVLKERTGNVSPNARKILEICSVFFNNVRYETLLAAAAMNEFELVEALEELAQKQLLLQDLQADKNDRDLAYRFYNLQTRSYVYSQMSTVRQRMLHKQAAFYLEQQLQEGRQNKDVYEHILYHYTNADEKLKILDYTIRLAEKYFCPQYEMFPELNPSYPAGYVDFRESRSQITACLRKIEELVNVLAAKNIPEEQLAIYKAAYWEMSGRYHIWRGAHLQGVRLIHQMLRLAAAKRFRDYQIKGYQQIIYCGIQTRKAHLIQRFALKLLRLTEHDPIPDKKATALRFLGIACALKGQQEQAEDYYRQSLALLKKLAGRNRFYAFPIAAANNYIGDLRRETFDYTAALRHYEQAIRIAGRKNISEGVALFYINAGYAAFQLRDYTKAGAYFTDALSVAEGLGDQKGYWYLRGYCTLNCMLALIAVRQDHPQEGKKHLEQAGEFLKQYNDPYQKAIVFRTQAEIKLLMQRKKEIAAVFADKLLLPAAEYHQQARIIFNKLGKAAELASLEEIMAAYESNNQIKSWF
ncbi:AAA family ATPase [Acetonema longum]|uniref:Transcriptional activator domain protein n=1 Tax=Acetonema longum DSM 6540 TaxID=1009370 RepID=F7NHF5_9FIRM|nr:AAA family ATPase [Acetonema longum]EGO64502.1 transcriptional activator domain protein [Acetonema longum DSM 6540]